MSGRAFVDTNVLVYAHDRGAGARHEHASALLRDLWRERSGVISTQVLQEFYVNVRRKAGRPIPAEEARRLVQDYLAWEVVVNDGDSILEALAIESRFGVAFWDALILQAANASGAGILYSEDFNHGQVYGSVEVVDPFRDCSPESPARP
jgi:predicted nucleic acid-binding protein